METTAQPWTKQAQQLRDRAAGLIAGQERDDLIKRAELLDGAVEMDALLSVRAPRKYL